MGGGTPDSSMNDSNSGLDGGSSARYTPNSVISTPSGISSSPAYGTPGSMNGSYTPQLMSSNDSSSALGSLAGPTFDQNRISELMNTMTKEQLAQLLGGKEILGGLPHTPTPTPGYTGKTPNTPGMQFSGK